MSTNEAAAPAAPTAVLTKKQRGRLKKLRKRLQEVKEGCELSGLTSMSDCLEWQELNASLETPLFVGTNVRLRKPSNSKELQRAEGFDSRAILWNIAQHLTKKSKRKRDEDLSIPLPSWCTLHNPCTVQSVAVIELELNSWPCTWEEIQEHVPVLSRLLQGQKGKEVLPVQTRWFQGPTPKGISDVLMYVPRPKSGKDVNETQTKREEENYTDASELEKVVELLNDLLLTEKLRRAEGFPMVDSDQKEVLPVQGNRVDIEVPLTCSFSLEEAKEVLQSFSVSKTTENGDHFVAATAHSAGQKSPKVFALDCEMVKTAVGTELARVTFLQLTRVGQDVDDQVSYKVVLDELVKPYGPVLDYLTQYSGVTAASLDPVTTRLEQVQAFVLSIVSRDDILIGHSLENDLHALRLVHDKVVDTAMVFRAANRRKYSLRHLSAALLGRNIQSDHGANGHCSEEDAAAALSLAVRRSLEGPCFRIFERGDDRFHILQQVCEGPMVCIGPSDWLRKHVTPFANSAHALTCESVADSNRKAIAAWLTSPKRRANLVWANLVACPREDNETSLAAFNECLSDVLERMLRGTVLLVCIQCEHKNAAEGAKQRKICMDRRSSLGWSSEQEEALSCVVDNCRSGLALWIGDASSEST